jgi:hypothetical protein
MKIYNQCGDNYFHQKISLLSTVDRHHAIVFFDIELSSYDQIFDGNIKKRSLGDEISVYTLPVS